MSINVKWIEIKGLRGFEKTGHIDLGIPNGKVGSGLTILLGPNNGGKSTIIEALNALSKPRPSSFSEGKRNKKARDCISIRTNNSQDEIKELRSVEKGGSETAWKNQGLEPTCGEIFVLLSRRTFNPYFSKGSMDREQYTTSYELPTIRGHISNTFFHRLFKIQEKKEDFDKIFQRVLTPLPKWTIDQSDTGQYYLKFNYTGQYHNSDGLGEGLLSLFLIIDALYDSKPNNIIIVDEPELSLHPSLQKKLANLFAYYAKDRQIILATHSPHFINWQWILNGAKIIRVIRESKGITVYQLSSKIIKKIKGLIGNLNNPHILGLDARSIFFLEDNVVLVEGQEDVVFYKLFEDKLDISLNGEFFGWGVGGAENMLIISDILDELGFKKVVGILDKNKNEVRKKLKRKYLNYKFYVIPADNVRFKPETPAKEAVEGLMDSAGNIIEEHKGEVINIFKEINSFFLGK
ncbi:MAG: AAA family ATPase [Candidatus Aminicenantes bacterium]|nr:AAA family ATPase [Candidatus Aminicenantes bacterium]